MRFAGGVDHVAFVTFDPEGTFHFYTEALGARLAHCITAKGWGPESYPDFAHFFFNIGGPAHIAFFYYFGVPPADVPLPPGVPRVARHLSLHCEDLDELARWEAHLTANDCKVSRTEHETITSIYFKDPNDIQLEMSAPNRPLTPGDEEDARLSVKALIEATREAAPSIERMWQIKGDLVARRAS